MKNILLVILLSSLFTFCNSDDNPALGGNQITPPVVDSFPVLTGPYLGQTVPGNTPKLFAHSIIKTGMDIRDIALTPDGQELYFSSNNEQHTRSTIYVTKIKDGAWTKPIPASFAVDPAIKYGEPFISPDGNRMYFISVSPLTPSSTRSDYNIWYMEREGSDWGAPKDIGAPINSELNEFFPSVSSNGTIYFTRGVPSEGSFIFRSKLINGEYEEPERLGVKINSTRDQYNAYISPDESYIIVPNGKRADSYGGTDYYVCFRNNADNSWSDPINLGNKINSVYSREWSASVSPDGKYLFFMSNRGPGNPNLSKIFWVDASLLHDLNPF